MANLDKLSDEELIAAQQENSVKRGKAEIEFKEKGSAIQFEIDKRLAKAQFGGGLTEAQKVALEELAAGQAAEEQEAATNG